jgi:hypothetical protein
VFAKILSVCFAEDRIVHLEIDEHSHAPSRTSECEIKKADSAGWGVSSEHLPTVIVRFNPNEYDKRRISLDRRCDALVSKLNELFRCDMRGFSPLGTNIIYMYYHTNAQHHIEAAKNASGSLKVIDIIE